MVAGRFHRRARPQSTGPGAIQPRPAPRRHRGVQPESRDHLRILDRALQLGAWLPDSGEPGHGTDFVAREGAPPSLQRRPNASVLRPTVSTASRAWTRAGVRGRGNSGICRARTSCGGAVVPAAPRMGRRAEGRRGRRCSRHPRSDGPPSRDGNRRGVALVLGAIGRPTGLNRPIRGRVSCIGGGAAVGPAERRTPLRGRGASDQRGATTSAGKAGCGPSGTLFRGSPRAGTPRTGQVLGTACGHEHEPHVARCRQD